VTQIDAPRFGQAPRGPGSHLGGLLLVWLATPRGAFPFFPGHLFSGRVASAPWASAGRIMAKQLWPSAGTCARFCWIIVATLFCCGSSQGTTPQATTTTTTTNTDRLTTLSLSTPYAGYTPTTTTMPADGPCGRDVRGCLDDEQCASCLAVINASVNFPHTQAEYVPCPTICKQRHENK
jgi:hypothetical protein